MRREERHAQAIPGYHRLAALEVSREDYFAMTCRSHGEDDYLVTYSDVVTVATRASWIAQLGGRLKSAPERSRSM